MTTEEWRAKYEANGRVDLWVEEEFNSGSRLVVSALPPAGPSAPASQRCALATHPPAILIPPSCSICCLQGGRAVHKGGYAGMDSGEGRPSGEDSEWPVHTVKIYSHAQVPNLAPYAHACSCGASRP